MPYDLTEEQRDRYRAAVVWILASSGQALKIGQAMLKILRLRSKYITERGATLNNPHVTKAHLDLFYGSSREVQGPNWALSIRNIAVEFAMAYPNHPAIFAK